MTRKTKYVIAASVALAALFIYLPALRNGFVGVWDDNIYIVENPHIRSLGAAGVNPFIDSCVCNNNKT